MPKLPESDLEILLNEEPDRSLALLEADIRAPAQGLAELDEWRRQPLEALARGLRQ